MSIFGDIVEGGAVERATELTLKTWIDTYLAEVERQSGRQAGSIQRPRSWINVADFERWQQLPCIMIISPGLSDVPTRDGDGYYRAVWTLGIAAIVSSRTKATALSLSRAYGAAIRGVMLQHRSLDGQAKGVSWLDERYDDLPDDKRILTAVRLVFDIELDKITSTEEGPIDPVPLAGSPPPEYGDWPVANTTIVEGDLT